MRTSDPVLMQPKLARTRLAHQGLVYSSTMLWTVLSVAVGCLLVFLAVQLFRYRGSDTWPIVEGTVETAEVRRWPQKSGGPACYVLVTYRFTLDGQSYIGEWHGPNFGPESDARDYIRQYVPVGAKLPVRYKRASPPLHLLDVDPATWVGSRPTTLDL
jgi:uncharacterized protein DUF3592